MPNQSDFFEECETAPRLNELARFFADTAAGRSGSPIKQPQVDRRLLAGDALMDEFVRLHEQRRGPFDQHYHSSIPYRLEEECRLGHAILKFSQSLPNALNLYSLGTAEATMARTIAEIAAGRVETLSCSPNIENYESFCAYGEPPHASFFVGPFHHLTTEMLRSRQDLVKFSTGFDIVFEDTTFQMYSPNRLGQIGFVAQHLKADGLFLAVEKFAAVDDAEYRRREHQKDHGFKARYFSPAAIEKKRATVLSVMNRNEVTLLEMAASLRQHFSHCSITWNSGNFYSIAASNSASNLKRFVSSLVEPAIPTEYVYEPLPMALFD